MGWVKPSRLSMSTWRFWTHRHEARFAIILIRAVSRGWPRQAGLFEPGGGRTSQWGVSVDQDLRCCDHHRVMGAMRETNCASTSCVSWAPCRVQSIKVVALRCALAVRVHFCSHSPESLTPAEWHLRSQGHDWFARFRRSRWFGLGRLVASC